MRRESEWQKLGGAESRRQLDLNKWLDAADALLESTGIAKPLPETATEAPVSQTPEPDILEQVARFNRSVMSSLAGEGFVFPDSGQPGQTPPNTKAA